MRKTRSLISIILALATILSAMCLPVFAEGENDAATSPDLSINAPAPAPITDIVNEDGSPVKVACIGDSITYGHSIDDKAFSYPSLLGQKLGDGYEVGNFGKSASYILPGDSAYNLRDDKTLSYRDTQQFQDSIAFAPDVVIIMLGTNDSTSLVSNEAAEVIEAELENIIKIYQELESVDRVYVMTSIFGPYSVTLSKSSDGPLQKLQQRAAAHTGAEFIDIYSLTRDYFDVMLHLSDRLHPDEDSYEAIPSACYALLTGTEYTPLEAPVAESGVVYVDSSSDGKGALTNDGLTPETPVSSIAYAAGLLRENGGTIVVMGAYSAYTSNGTFMPKTNGTIKITSTYDGVDYAATNGALLKMNSTYFYLGGDVIFDDITIHSTSNTIIVCNYNDMTMGDNVTCTVASGKSYPMILTGYNVTNGGVPAEYVSFNGTCNVTINSGTFTYIRNGNRRGSTTATVGTVGKGACVTATINGGTFTQLDTTNNTGTTGMNNTEGDCNLIINGGSFAGRIYGVIRGGGISGEITERPYCSGNVNIYINGGKFAATVRGVQTDTDNTVNYADATVNLIVSKRYEDRNSNFVNFTNIDYVDYSTVITTPDQILELMNDETMWDDKHYVLGADIDLSTYTGALTQKPIGNYDIPFTGCFDGAGHKISGIDITAEGTVGFFGCVELADIRNLTVDGSVKNTFAAANAETMYISARKLHGTTGLLVGTVFTQSNISNCKAYGTTSGNGNVGGMFGFIKSMGTWTIVIENCENYAVPTNTLGNTGGLASRITSNGTAKIGVEINNCANYADITSASNDRNRVAGLVGYARNETNQIVFENCDNYGDLDGRNTTTTASNRPFVGGMVGRAETTYPSGGNTTQASSFIVTNCRNFGTIKGNYMTGGIFGYIQRSSTVTGEVTFSGCVNYGEIDGTSAGKSTYVGGILGYAQNENASVSYTIKNCANYGALTVDKANGMGGIVGRSRNCVITNCYAEGTVTGTSVIGAIVGLNESNVSTATNCYADAAMTAKLVGKESKAVTQTDCALVATESLGLKDSYAGFDFNKTWTIKDGAPALDCYTVGASGDIDADGAVTSADITLAVRYLSKYSIGYTKTRFDMNGDGKITNRDVIALIQAIAE